MIEDGLIVSFHLCRALYYIECNLNFNSGHISSSKAGQRELELQGRLRPREKSLSSPLPLPLLLRLPRCRIFLYFVYYCQSGFLADDFAL